MERKQQKKGTSGITLIALVVTIVILLILAGVSINLVLGPNGLITKAQEASLKTNEAQEKEGIEMAITSSKMEDVKTLEISKDSLENALREQFGNNKDVTVTDNGDGSFLINMNDTQRSYYVESTGDIIDESNMIEIGTAEELKAFRDDVNSGNTYEGKYVKLTNDITLDIEEEWEPIGLYLNDNANPYDESNIPFKGTFNGENHEINGIYINTEDKAQGLFGLINNGKVMNVNIGKNCSITGGKATAGVVGYAYNNSVISNCSNDTNINVAFGGSIVGCEKANTTIKNCYNTGKIIGTSDMIGGIVGYSNQDSIIKECHNEGIVTGNKNVGGIIGLTLETIFIKNCYNEGNITGKSSIGGICGNLSMQGEIKECYNTGIIEATDKYTSGNSNVGGIIGLNISNIENCYNRGTITGAYGNIGGIIGLNRGTLKNSYNAGSVNGEIEAKGCLVGNNNEFYYSETDTTYIGKIHNCYSLEGLSENLYGINNSIIGNECSFKTSTELQNLYSTLGEAFKADTNNINNGYPILSWQ